MTRDDVIEIGQLVGMVETGDLVFRGSFEKMTQPEQKQFERLERFADLVEAHKRVETEINFCSRCGKRLGDAGHIHTCTPPAARKALTGPELTALHDKLGGKPERPTVNESKLGKRWSETL